MAARKPPVTDPSLYGRNGQAQHGVDFALELQDGVHGYQCKLVEEICFEAFEAEVNKTGGFPTDLQEFVVLTAAKRDATVQSKVTALSLRRRREGRFPVSLVYWTTIQGWLAEHMDVLKAHYPQITPDFVDLFAASARRLERDFPGSHLTVTARPGLTEYTVYPGKDGISFSSSLIGEDAAERLQRAFRRGVPVTFENEEFQLGFPPALSMMAPRREGARRSITLTPALNGKAARVRLEVAPKSRHRNLDQFIRRAKRRAHGIPAELRFLQMGTELQMVEVVPQDLPLRFVLRQELVDGVMRGRADADRDYFGAPVGLAAAAEEVFCVLDEGAYSVVLGENITLGWENEADGTSDRSLLCALQLLADLADAADWDIPLPEPLEAVDVREAAGLLELFTNGRRVLGRGGSVRIDVLDQAQLEELKRLIEEDDQPFTAALESAQTEIEFCGQTQLVPRTVIRYSRIEIPESARALVLGDPELPFSIEFNAPDDVDIIEELVEVG